MFLILTIAAALLLAIVCLFTVAISTLGAEIQQSKRKIELDLARIDDYAHKHEERKSAAQQRAELHAAKIAKENNAVVLQDTKIELEQIKLELARLELAKLQKEINPPEFGVSDYSSDRAPFESKS